MAVTLPENPRFVNNWEEKVWRALDEQLGPDDLIVVGQRVTDHKKDHEIDFVVAIEGAGVICVEVKGGNVWHDGNTWRQSTADGPKAINPVEQARGGCYALRSFVEGDQRWNQPWLRWDHAVVLPGAKLAQEFALPECPRWKVTDKSELTELVSRLRAVLLDKETTNPVLKAAGIEQLRLVLSGRGLTQRDIVAQAQDNEDTAQILTEHQAVILDAIRLLNRIEVRGGAGSGKTFLALEQARRLSAAGKRVALVCYSHGLASYLRRLTSSWSRRQQPAYVGEFHTLGVQWGAPVGPDESVRTPETQQFWEYDLPREMTEIAATLMPGHRFDAIVVDEAQDFADNWWQPLLAALRDPDAGGIYVFSDEGQRVFDRFGAPPIPLVPLVLDHNLRNTRQIATAFQPLVDSPMRFMGGDGPDVSFVPCSAGESLGVGDDQVDVLLEQGWRPEDVALLTTGSRHPEQVARQAEGNEKYWDSFWDVDQVFYGHVLSFKGLERRAVVLVVNESERRERSKERLYVGLSRARDQLVVCGDPEFIREVGGPDLAHRLKLPTTAK